MLLLFSSESLLNCAAAWTTMAASKIEARRRRKSEHARGEPALDRIFQFIYMYSEMSMNIYLARTTHFVSCPCVPMKDFAYDVLAAAPFNIGALMPAPPLSKPAAGMRPTVSPCHACLMPWALGHHVVRHP